MCRERREDIVEGRDDKMVESLWSVGLLWVKNYWNQSTRENKLGGCDKEA